MQAATGTCGYLQQPLISCFYCTMLGCFDSQSFHIVAKLAHPSLSAAHFCWSVGQSISDGPIGMCGEQRVLTKRGLDFACYNDLRFRGFWTLNKLLFFFVFFMTELKMFDLTGVSHCKFCITLLYHGKHLYWFLFFGKGIYGLWMFCLDNLVKKQGWCMQSYQYVLKSTCDYLWCGQTSVYI